MEKIDTVNDRGEKVLEGSAQVAQPTTIYVFTGQGSREPGMGIDLYSNSPTARAVWEAADGHLLAVYGFSIVKDNPKEKTIHFGGIKSLFSFPTNLTTGYLTDDAQCVAVSHLLLV
jgi:fatty acid synthase subunit alpha, fungi type